MTEWVERAHINNGQRCWCKDRMDKFVIHKTDEELEAIRKEMDR